MRVCLITGGTKGVGQQIAKTLQSSGQWKVICTSRDSNKVTNSKNNLEVMQLNVLQDTSTQQFIDILTQSSIKIDLLIHNAGIGYFDSFEQLTEMQINELFQTNAIAPILLTKKIIPLLNPEGARIITIGTIVENRAASGNSVYAASKSALRSFADQMNEENKNKNFSFTHLSLGAVKTEIWEKRTDFDTKGMIPIEELSALFLFLANLPLSVRVDHIDYFPKKGLL